MSMTRRHPTSFFVSFPLIAIISLGSAAAQETTPPVLNTPLDCKERICVTIGQPSLWSLEQAHYFLARVRDKAKALQSGNIQLDPATVAGTRVERRISRFGASAGFNDVVGAKNRIVREDAELDLARKRQIIDSITTKRGEIATLQGEIADLTGEKASLEAHPGSDDNRLTEIVEAIATKTSQVMALQEQISGLAKERDAISVSPDFDTTTEVAPAAPSDLSSLSQLESLLQGTDPEATLDPSTLLDKYIQLQYEIVAKQMTLLRDEVRGDQRLVFLEIPYSFYTVKAKGRLAQVGWKIEGFYQWDLGYIAKPAGEGLLSKSDLGKSTAQRQLEQDLEDIITASVQGADALLPRNGDWNWLLEGLRERGTLTPENLQLLEKGLGELPEAQIQSLKAEFDKTQSETAYARGLIQLANGVSQKQLPTLADEGPLGSQLPEKLQNIETIASPAEKQAALQFGKWDWLGLNKWPHDPTTTKKGLLTRQELRRFEERLDNSQRLPKPGEFYIREFENARQDGRLAGSSPLEYPKSEHGQVRTLDIVPRSATLNVRQIYSTRSNWAVAANFLKLFLGFGAKLGYERLKEQYSQFINQEFSAAGYGKGETAFGWIFGPKPGMSEIAPGIKTTFAILVVPRTAVGIRLQPSVIAYKRDSRPGDAKSRGTAKSVDLVVPQLDEGFYLSSIYYHPSKQGQIATVVFGGIFSEQIGILVNGQPLKRVVSIGDVLDSDGAVVEPGEFEFVSSGQLVAAIKMPAGYKGTPDITFVAPQKTATINRFTTRINGHFPEKLADYGRRNPMFHPGVSLTDLRLAGTAGSAVDLVLTGTGLDQFSKILIGTLALPTRKQAQRANPKGTSWRDPVSANMLKLRLDKPLSEASAWDITIIVDRGQAKEEVSRPFENPLTPSVSGYRFLSQPGSSPARVVLEGSGFRPGIRIDDVNRNLVLSDFEVLSPHEIFMRGLVAPNRVEDPYLLRITNCIGTDQSGKDVFGPARIVSIAVPRYPTVRKVNPSSGKEKMAQTVVLEGENLQQVVSVLFGSVKADIVSRTPTALTVFVQGAAASKQRVIVQSSIEYFGKKLTNQADFLEGGSNPTFEYKEAKQENGNGGKKLDGRPN